MRATRCHEAHAAIQQMQPLLSRSARAGNRPPRPHGLCCPAQQQALGLHTLIVVTVSLQYLLLPL